MKNNNSYKQLFCMIVMNTEAAITNEFSIPIERLTGLLGELEFLKSVETTQYHNAKIGGLDPTIKERRIFVTIRVNGFEYRIVDYSIHKGRFVTMAEAEYVSREGKLEKIL